MQEGVQSRTRQKMMWFDSSRSCKVRNDIKKTKGCEEAVLSIDGVREPRTMRFSGLFCRHLEYGMVRRVL